MLTFSLQGIFIFRSGRARDDDDIEAQYDSAKHKRPRLPAFASAREKDLRREVLRLHEISQRIRIANRCLNGQLNNDVPALREQIWHAVQQTGVMMTVAEAKFKGLVEHVDNVNNEAKDVSNGLSLSISELTSKLESAANQAFVMELSNNLETMRSQVNNVLNVNKETMDAANGIRVSLSEIHSKMESFAQETFTTDLAKQLGTLSSQVDAQGSCLETLFSSVCNEDGTPKFMQECARLRDSIALSCEAQVRTERDNILADVAKQLAAMQSTLEGSSVSKSHLEGVLNNRLEELSASFNGQVQQIALEPLAGKRVQEDSAIAKQTAETAMTELRELRAEHARESGHYC